MRSSLLAAAALLSGSAAIAVPPLPPPEAKVAEIARAVDAARLKAAIETMVGFSTRHTLSSQTDPKRGIGAAVRWAEAEMKSYGLETFQTCDTVTGRRVPTPTKVCNAVSIQRGTERPNDVVIITGHIDSRVTDVMDFTKDAPGANDDGSGTAAVIEAARVLSKHKFPGTIVYAALSGEEQGLLGGKILADYAKAQGWNVIANLNNDIIGNSCGSDGVCNDKQVRIFSEGPRWQGREDLAALLRSQGGENDSPSRNLSRFLDTLAERLHGDIGLDVMPIWRNDRFGRGGDHTEFLNAGYPAVRFSVAVENYDQQHQDVRTTRRSCSEIKFPDPLMDACVVGGDQSKLPVVEYGDTIDKMDFPYLAKVTKLNVAALAWLASAPLPPAPTVGGAVSTDTGVSWNDVAGAADYVVRWRRTDASQWEQSARKGSPGVDWIIRENSLVSTSDGGIIANLRGIRVDDWVFGVSSVSMDGFESPVAAAVPGGAFRPYVKPAETK